MHAPSPFSSISIKATPVVEPVRHISTEVVKLTDENLLKYWNEASVELGLQELMSEAIPHLGDRPGSFEIDAQTVSFADEFKPHKIDVMEFLRSRTGMKTLDCKVNPRFIEKTEVVYSPDDKYAAMLADNPQLEHLRKLFPLIDY